MSKNSPVLGHHRRDRSNPAEKSVKFKDEIKEQIHESPIKSTSPFALEKENLEFNTSLNNPRMSSSFTKNSLINPLNSMNKPLRNMPSIPKPPLTDLEQSLEYKLLTMSKDFE